MSRCPHYEGTVTQMRYPLPKERFTSKQRSTCVCECGVCMGWKRHDGKMEFNPILTDSQKIAVMRFFGVTDRQLYGRDYYRRVTKPKREAARAARLTSPPS